ASAPVPSDAYKVRTYMKIRRRLTRQIRTGFLKKKRFPLKRAAKESQTMKGKLSLTNKQNPDGTDLDHSITRRKFIGTTAVSSAALLSGGLVSLLRSTASATNFDFIEATIPQLQAAM